MRIDFDSMEEIASPNFKGGEGIVYRRGFHDGMGKIIRLRLEQGSSIGYHQHVDDCEIMYIVSGRARCLYNGETIELKAGDVHYCAKGQWHSMMNPYKEPLIIFGVLPEQ